MAKNLCIIPARGGSKRIPRKNIKDFLGKPIIAYSIEVALSSGLFDEVMVSTDDQEVADIAINYGATIPFYRSPENADDYATTVDVVLEVLKTYSEQGEKFEKVCCIYPCAPFVTVNLLKKADELLRSGNTNGIFPVVPFEYPIQRALRLKENNTSFFYPEFESARSQDLEEAYHDAGQFYFLNVDSIINTESIFSEQTRVIEVSPMEVQDIDTESDWKLAELKYKLLNG